MGCGCKGKSAKAGENAALRQEVARLNRLLMAARSDVRKLKKTLADQKSS